jgi:mannose-1-phosphate guanylyltransferase/mannose-6-phosphate isomerase
MIDHVPPTIEVDKPWGKFEQYTHNTLSTVKVITLQPGAALSLQYHHSRDELWVVLDAGAQIELDNTIIHPRVGDKVFIPRTTAHRLSASSDRPVRILEVSFGEFDEDDIVRLEDIYGRVPV